MKTLILTHSDCDGMCAGALALSMFPGSRVFFTKPVSFLSDLRYNENGHERPERIVICDLALTSRDARTIVDELRKMHDTGIELLYFDHHPLPKGITLKKLSFISALSHAEGACTAEQVYKYFEKQLPPECAWLAIYGAIGDYLDDTHFARQAMLNWDKRTLYFEVSTLVMGIKNDEFGNYGAKRDIVRTLAKGKNPSDVPGLVQAAKQAVDREFKLYEYVKKKAKSIRNIAYLEGIPAFGFRGPSALFAATVRDKPVGLCVYRRKNHIDITIRSRNPRLNLGRLAEQAAHEVDGSGGGLAGAAGARIAKNAFQAFVKKLNSLI